MVGIYHSYEIGRSERRRLVFGGDLLHTCSKVPRHRVVPHRSYLSFGVNHACKTHHDTGHSGPTAQVNGWMPGLPSMDDKGLERTYERKSAHLRRHGFAADDAYEEFQRAIALEYFLPRMSYAVIGD